MSNYEPGGSRLPFAMPPQPDELLSSWVTRLAYAHLVKVYTFGKLLFPRISLWNRDLDKLGPEAVLTTLAACTSTPLERIRETTLRSFESRLYLRHNPNGNTRWLLPLGIYHRVWRRCGLLYCPHCLARDGTNPYFRKQWRLALALVCERCGIYLHEKCPHCAKPVVFFRGELGDKYAIPEQPLSLCYHCGFELARAPGVAAPLAVWTQQREWYRILREGWRAEVAFPHLYFDVLHHLARVLLSINTRCRPLQVYLQAMTWPDPEWRGSGLPQAVTSLEHVSLEVRRRVLYQAAWLLHHWPFRFEQVIHACGMTSTALFRDMTDVPFWYHQLVLSTCYVSNTNRRFAAIEAAVVTK